MFQWLTGFVVGGLLGASLTAVAIYLMGAYIERRLGQEDLSFYSDDPNGEDYSITLH